MSRYTLRNASNLLYSDNAVLETVWESIPGNPSVAAPRSLLRPVFGAVDATRALKYGTPDDAAFVLTNPDFVDPSDFSGCTVVEVEFDPLDPGAVRVVPV
jgi:hypothetical protein